MNPAKFLIANGISYDNIGSSSTFLEVVRTPHAVSVSGSVNEGAETPGGISFHLCTDRSKASIKVNGETMTGDHLASFLNTIVGVKERMKFLQADLNDFQDDPQDYVCRFEQAVDDSEGEDYVLFLLAMRPLNMSRSDLEKVVGLTAYYVRSMNVNKKGEGYLAGLHGKNSFYHWRYAVLINALAEAGIVGDDAYLERRFFDMAIAPDPA